MNTIKVKKKDIKKILEFAYPEYNGKKFFVNVAENVRFHDTNWCGGTRNEYVAVCLNNGDSVKNNKPSPWTNTIEGKLVEIPENIVIAEHRIFMGKDLGITFHVNPKNVNKLLPQYGG